MNTIPGTKPSSGTISFSPSRPTLLTVLTGYFFIHWLFSLFIILLVVILHPGGSVPTFGEVLNQAGPVFLGVSSQTSLSIIIWVIIVATLGGVIGMWFMQRWAYIIYVAATIALAIFYVRSITSPFTSEIWYAIITTFVVNVALIIIGGYYFKRMK
jgi:hypothetical protein